VRDQSIRALQKDKSENLKFSRLSSDAGARTSRLTRYGYDGRKEPLDRCV
jgi:hypothetical protein